MNQNLLTHRRGRTLWIVFGSILIGASLWWGSFNVIALIAHEEWTSRYEVPADGITTLQLDNDHGRIEIRGGDVDEITVVADVSRGLRPTTERHEVVGSALRIGGECPGVMSQWCWVEYDIVVPRDLTLRINTDDSPVSLTDLGGTIDVDSDNGSLQLVDVTGDVTAHTDNGRITGTGLSGEVVTASTENGRVNLSFLAVPETVVISTDNGRVDLAVPAIDDGYRVMTRVDNGSVDVGVIDNPSSARLIQIATDNGSIRVRSVPS